MTANLDLTKLPSLVLNGVDHSARPTWKLRETIEFYRDKLGLPLVHAITAKGWGRAKEKHADFIHFFFEAGKGATIAFFYYIGTEQPPELVVPRGYMAMANHTAWASKRRRSCSPGKRGSRLSEFRSASRSSTRF